MTNDEKIDAKAEAVILPPGNMTKILYENLSGAFMFDCLTNIYLEAL